MYDDNLTTFGVISYSMLQLNQIKSKTFQVDLLKIWHINKRAPVLQITFAKTY